MVVASSTTPPHKTSYSSQSNPKRLPLLPSPNQNEGIQRRPKARQVHSRYLSSSPSSSSTSNSSTSTASPSSSSSRRCPPPSPLPSSPRATPMSAVKRAQSVEKERRRPRSSSGEMSEAAKLLVNASRRSLSVSFQGESYAVPRNSNKIVKSVSPMLERKRNVVTPRREVENARPIEQPWPGRVVSLSRSVDLGSGKVVRALQESLISDGNNNNNDNRVSLHATLRKSLSRVNVGSESLISDVESLSSHTNYNLTVGGRVKGGGRSIVAPPRLKRGSEPDSLMARINISKLNTPENILSDSPGMSPRGTVSNGGFSSPLRGASKPASPSKLGGTSVSERTSSPSRGMGRVASPLRSRNIVASTPSLLCFGVDARTMVVGDNRLADAHLLRLLHNRHLQWRFVNDRAESSLLVQQVNVQRSLYNAWRIILDLSVAVSIKRKELQWLSLKLKLLSILKGQILHLEEWALMDKDHCSSLSGAIESLKSSTTHLPLVSGARADIHDLKDAICSAADMMHSMASSICSLSRKVVEVNSLVGELASLTSKEHSFLMECQETLSMLAAMQIKDCSLRAHALQLKYAPPSASIEV